MPPRSAHASTCHLKRMTCQCVSCGTLARSLARERYGHNFLKHSRRFVDATGRLPSEQDVFRQKKVGSWLIDRRGEAKRGDLSRERMELMKDALGADVLVAAKNIDFERNVADFAEYIRLHGRNPTPHGDARHLAAWISRQRVKASKGLLSAAHAQRLDTVLSAGWRPEFNNGRV